MRLHGNRQPQKAMPCIAVRTHRPRPGPAGVYWLSALMPVGRVTG
jgi:hypothetical protein